MVSGDDIKTALVYFNTRQTSVGFNFHNSTHHPQSSGTDMQSAGTHTACYVTIFVMKRDSCDVLSYTIESILHSKLYAERKNHGCVEILVFECVTHFK